MCPVGIPLLGGVARAQHCTLEKGAGTRSEGGVGLAWLSIGCTREASAGAKRRPGWGVRERSRRPLRRCLSQPRIGSRGSYSSNSTTSPTFPCRTSSRREDLGAIEPEAFNWAREAGRPGDLPGPPGRRTLRRCSTGHPTASFFAEKGPPIALQAFGGYGVRWRLRNASLGGKALHDRRCLDESTHISDHPGAHLPDNRGWIGWASGLGRTGEDIQSSWVFRH